MYWNFTSSLSNEYSGLIFFRIDWFDLFTVQGTLKSLLHHHNLNTSILQHSAFLWSNSHIYSWLLEKSSMLLPGKCHGWRSPVGCSPWGPRSQTRLSNFILTFHFHALEKEMATNSSVLAWRIPGMGEPGGLLSLGSHRGGHNWSNLSAAGAEKS